MDRIHYYGNYKYLLIDAYETTVPVSPDRLHSVGDYVLEINGENASLKWCFVSTRPSNLKK